MMRLVGKILRKLVMFGIMVAVLGTGMRYARPHLMKSAGLPDSAPGVPSVGAVHFSSEESDVMKTVLTDAIRFLTGQASRKELSADLSNKLYAGSADPATMKELGIELVQPGASPGDGTAGGTPPANSAAANPGAGTSPAMGNPGGMPPGGQALGAAVPGSSQPATGANGPGANHPVAAKNPSPVLLAMWQKSMANPELALMPLVCAGMVSFRLLRRRKRSLGDDLSFIPDMSKLIPSDSEPYTMTHALHGLKADDFELLVALVYQRQGYRVSMPAGLSGGRGGDFLLTKKNERLLVQCKNTRQDFKVPVERIRELHEAVGAAGATGGLYVASCGFTWDARNFGKANNVTAINARTLDQLVTAAHEKHEEALLSVAEWAPGFMAKVKLTPPACPTCESTMDQLRVSAGTVWVCSDRPACKGRRIGRSYLKENGAASGSAEAVPSAKGVAKATAPAPAKGDKPKKAAAAVPVGAETDATAKGQRVTPAAPPAKQAAAAKASSTHSEPIVESMESGTSVSDPVNPGMTRRVFTNILRAKPRPGMATVSARPAGL